jgi:hypothetical protein
MRTLVSVPYPCPDGFPSVRRTAFVGPILRTFADSRRKMSSANVTLELSGKSTAAPLSADDLPLIVITHNQGTLLWHFLAHYRRLGVTRFLCVDDASTDGTHELLAAQLDVDLYTSNVRYKGASRGRLWREMLVSRYGTWRWYVLVDTDEFLIYRGHETVPLPQVLESLGQRRISHLPAPMLDM